MNTKKQRNKDHIKLDSALFKHTEDAMPNETAVENLINGGSNSFMKECRRSRDRFCSVEPTPLGNAAKKMLKRVREKSFFWLGRQHQRVDRRIRMLTNKNPYDPRAANQRAAFDHGPIFGPVQDGDRSGDFAPGRLYSPGN